MPATKARNTAQRSPVEMRRRKFGRLTVLSRSHRKRNHRNICWNCHCECGNVVEIQGYDLRCGKTRSCGCLMREQARRLPLIDLTGQTFCRLTVLHRVERDRPGEAKWKCQCSCGGIRIVTGTQLRSGQSTSCGCLRRKIVLADE